MFDRTPEDPLVRLTEAWILPLASPDADLALVGGKGAALARMAGAGFPVPPAFHLTTHAYRAFVRENGLAPIIERALQGIDYADPASVAQAAAALTEAFQEAAIPAPISGAIRAGYEALPGSEPAVAVRSSATAEDLPHASFAGQQASFLNVRGVDGVLAAVRRCWASLWSDRAIGYRHRQAIPHGDVALAVIVQLLVPADAAGILFTANPVTGSRKEMIINGAWGLGDAVVGGRISPDTLTIDRNSATVVRRHIGAKQLQTTPVPEGVADKPVSDAMRPIPVLRDDQAAALARLGQELEVLFGLPLDIEWARAGDEFAILQARPITALPDSEPTPSVWQLPPGAYAAMRNNIVELMTEPLTPLFKTLGLNAVNTGLTHLLDAFLGETGVLPDNPIIVVNEYAYYNGSVRFWPMLKILLQSRHILQRMLNGAVERWTETGRPHYVRQVAEWEGRAWQNLPTQELLTAVGRLTEDAVEAYGALVSGAIPAAWMSEAWFTFLYRLIRRRGDPPAATYLLGFDSLPIRAEKALHDLARWCRADPALTGYLSTSTPSQLRAQLDAPYPPESVDRAVWEQWRHRVREHLREYGHMIYCLDFGWATPADDPRPILATLCLFLKGEGLDPHHRQQVLAEQREAAIRAITGRLRGWRRERFQNSLRRAQKYAPLREDGLADVGLAYPLLRRMLREIGDRLVQAGVIHEAEDLYWLEQEEVATAAASLDGRGAPASLAHRIPERKAVWRAAGRISPPRSLPQMRILGRDVQSLVRALWPGQPREILTGVAAGPGRVTARACVLHRPEDFDQMHTGDVLIASLTTPAWTPLFARASAVVTDIGGPLSHGSIVAREYGIPAVLGTGNATTRIRSGQRITVDGDKGEIHLEPAVSADSAAPPRSQRVKRPA